MMICCYIYNLNIMNLLIGEGNLITNLFFQQESFEDTDKNWSSVPLPWTVTTMGWSLEWYPRTKTLCRSKHRYITQEIYIPRISQHFASLHWQWCLIIEQDVTWYVRPRNQHINLNQNKRDHFCIWQCHVISNVRHHWV